MRRMGIPAKMCDILFSTLQQMQHFVRATYGDSTESYGVINIPLQGILQGNGAGPAIWLVMTAPLIQTLKDAGCGIEFTSPFSQSSCKCVGYMFVDGCDLVTQPTQQDPTSAELSQAMRWCVQLWEETLRATGGALVIAEKSYWYMIKFIYHNDHWHYATQQEAPGEIFVKDHSGQHQLLTRLVPKEARETLGTWIAMDGNQKQQIRALQKKIDKWHDQVRLNSLSTDEAWIAFHTGLLKSLQYPLPACNLTKQEAKQIQVKLLNTLLPVLHIRRTFPSQILTVSIKYGGLAIPTIWIEQGLAKIEACLRHGSTSTMTGKFIQTTLENLHVELGTPTRFTKLSWEQYHALTTNTWLHSIWQFCFEHNIHLHYPEPHIPLLRQHDQYIIPHLLNLGLPKQDLIRANYCRMWLQVFCLSDITTGDGQFITLETWHGNCNNDNIWGRWPRSE